MLTMQGDMKKLNRSPPARHLGVYFILKNIKFLSARILGPVRLPTWASESSIQYYARDPHQIC
jgi:hypothetical protein